MKRWIESYQKSKYRSATHTNAMNIGTLFGYISGVSDSSKDICLPESKDFGDLTNDVIGYVNAHPEIREISAALLANCTINGGNVQIQVGGGNNQMGTYTAPSQGDSLLIWIKRVWGWIKRWWGGS
ncbi:Rap1a/Tai family immunity protein [Yersinia similis]|uniref:Rap1a/Tai family immunity protein n=1 Tax=Yersinia similis TaxID=367190 RepID=UPI0038516C4A